MDRQHKLFKVITVMLWMQKQVIKMLIVLVLLLAILWVYKILVFNLLSIVGLVPVEILVDEILVLVLNQIK